MLLAKQLFDINLRHTRDLDSVYLNLKATVGGPLDLSDLLRAEFVFAVSALDKLVHDIVRMGMVEIYLGFRPVTPAYENYRINLATHTQISASRLLVGSSPALIAYPPEYWFEQDIIKAHSHLSFQNPDKISEILSYIINEKHKWHIIAEAMSMTRDEVKQQLSSIVDRRNKIAHEGDYNPLSQLRFEIDHNDVANSVNFIDRVGTAVFDLCKL